MGYQPAFCWTLCCMPRLIEVSYPSSPCEENIKLTASISGRITNNLTQGLAVMAKYDNQGNVNVTVSFILYLRELTQLQLLPPTP